MSSGDIGKIFRLSYDAGGVVLVLGLYPLAGDNDLLKLSSTLFKVGDVMCLHADGRMRYRVKETFTQGPRWCRPVEAEKKGEKQ